jgi:hypothetical protein
LLKFTKKKSELLIGSVYYKSESANNKLWYSLQQKFISKNTNSFDFVVYSNYVDQKIFDPDHIIYAIDGPIKKALHGHGLNFIINYAIKKNYKKLLLLDSDCFPILNDWQEKLEKDMDDFLVAAIVRCEKLDLFLHPSACYIRDLSKTKIKFSYVEISNLISSKFTELSGNIDIKKFYPLLRSNAVNINPLLFGVYKNMFYHHGAGSYTVDPVKYNKGGPMKGYYGKGYYGMKNYKSINEIILKKLESEPELFIKYLSEYKPPI